MTKLVGSCHCGAVRFQISGAISELTTCDCSICIKKNAVMTKVSQNNFQLLSDSANLSEYNWNTKVARHFFCKECGIYTFHRKRAQPDHYGINIFCLDNFDVSKLETRATDGKDMSLIDDVARTSWKGPRMQPKEN